MKVLRTQNNRSYNILEITENTRSKILYVFSLKLERSDMVV